MSRWTRVMDSAKYLNVNMEKAPVMMIPLLEGRPDGAAERHAGLATLDRYCPAVWSFMLAVRERGLGTAWTTLHLIGTTRRRSPSCWAFLEDYTQAGLFPSPTPRAPTSSWPSDFPLSS